MNRGPKKRRTTNRPRSLDGSSHRSRRLLSRGRADFFLRRLASPSVRKRIKAWWEWGALGHHVVLQRQGACTGLALHEASWSHHQMAREEEKGGDCKSWRACTEVSPGFGDPRIQKRIRGHALLQCQGKAATTHSVWWRRRCGDLLEQCGLRAHVWQSPDEWCYVVTLVIVFRLSTLNREQKSTNTESLLSCD